MGKGVLLELDGRQAVVLTQQGEFKRVPLPKGSASLGDEIEFADAKPSPWATWGTAAAAAAVLLLAPFGWQAYTLTQPVAIVTMDINPSLQLTLNKADQVLKAEALNQDGGQVLKDVKWQRKPVDLVVAEVTAKAAEARKLDVADASSAVVVAVAPVAEEELPAEQAHRIRDKAYAAISTQVTEQADAQRVTALTNLAVLEVSVAEKAEAKAAGITPGKLVISKKLQEKGIEIQPAELQKTGPGKLLHNYGQNPGQIFGEAQEEHGGQPAIPDNKGKGKSDDKENGRGNDDNPGKGNSGQNEPQTQPAATQPAGPGKSDDKGGNKQEPDKSGKGSDNSNKSDDDDDNEKDDRGNSGGKNDDADEAPNGKKGKGNSGSNGKKEAWTLPFGIEVPKPAFMQPKNNSSTSPRAEAPGVGASPSDENAREQEKLQRELDKQRAEKEKEALKQQEKREKDGK